MAGVMVSETVDAEGHLIDSGDLQAILTTIVEQGASYEILHFDIGRTNAVPVAAVAAACRPRPARALDHLLATLSTFGCYVQGAPDALVRVNDIDGAAPVDFYSTTNHRTQVLVGGQWTAVERQRMDAAIVVRRRPRSSAASCASLKAGDRVVCGMQGIRVLPDLQDRDKPTFGFMSNDVSSERRVEVAVSARRRRCCARPAPAARRSPSSPVRSSSTPAAREYFCELIRLGFVDVVLGGQRPGRARHRSGAVGHLARHRPRHRAAGGTRASQSHARHQRHPPRRRHRRTAVEPRAC